MGVSVQSVGDLVRGDSAHTTPERNIRAARFFGCNPNWLATGVGPSGWSDDSSDPAPAGVTEPEHEHALRLTVEQALASLADALATASEVGRVAATTLLQSWITNERDRSKLAVAIAQQLDSGRKPARPSMQDRSVEDFAHFAMARLSQHQSAEFRETIAAFLRETVEAARRADRQAEQQPADPHPTRR